MKKALPAAIALAGSLGFAAAANAVNVNHDGLGEVLLYSYYTTEDGNDSLINITNTTDQVKAVKVRFVESMNSQEVLDFNLYLSPYDVWTAAVTKSANGAKLITPAGVISLAPLADLVTAAVQTSYGDRYRLKSRTSWLFMDSTKRTFTALTWSVVFVMLISESLPSSVV